MWIDQRGSDILPIPECFRLLALAAKEDHVGRLAVADGPTPLVVPVNFTYHDKSVLVRLGPGRLSELVRNCLVTFEVDRVEPDRGQAWSVLVHGLASPLAPGVSGLGALPRPFVPEPGDEVLIIRADVVSGRRFSLVARADPGAEAAASAVSSG
jgi:hypothetical protein